MSAIILSKKKNKGYDFKIIFILIFLCANLIFTYKYFNYIFFLANKFIYKTITHLRKEFF